MPILFGFFKISGAPQSNADIAPSAALAKVKEGALLVDSRTIEEFNSGHIEGALNIPHTETKVRLLELGGDKNKEIIFYCKSGGRSGMAQKILKEEGFLNVFNAGAYENLLACK